jgi:hypothetical protein
MQVCIRILQVHYAVKKNQVLQIAVYRGSIEETPMIWEFCLSRGPNNRNFRVQPYRKQKSKQESPSDGGSALSLFVGRN